MTKIVHISIIDGSDIIDGDFSVPMYYDESALTAEDIRTDSMIQPA